MMVNHIVSNRQRSASNGEADVVRNKSVHLWPTSEASHLTPHNIIVYAVAEKVLPDHTVTPYILQGIEY